METRKKSRQSLVRIISLILCVSMLWIMPPEAAAVTIPTDASMREQLVTTYEKAVAYDKAKSRPNGGKNKSNYFQSLCAYYANVQLLVLGVTTQNPGGNGNQQFANYKNGYKYTNRKIHAYPASQYTVGKALEAISAECPVATNIMLCFKATNTTSGKQYGHAMLIQGIIDGKVYFTDNFTINRSAFYIPACTPGVLTISQMQGYYGSSWFTFDGAIWFEDQALTAAVKNGGYVPGESEEEKVIPADTVGQYKIINSDSAGGLNLRASNTTKSASLGKIKDGTLVYASEIKDGWACIYSKDLQKDGWVSTDYLTKTGDMPAVLSDWYDKKGVHVDRTTQTSLQSAINSIWNLDGYSGVITMFADGEITQSRSFDENVTINSNGYRLSIAKDADVRLRGATVISSERLDSLLDDPFILCEEGKNTYTYQCCFGVHMEAASLEITDKVAIKLAVSFTSTTMPTDGTLDCVLKCRVMGRDETYTATLADADEDYLFFVTRGLPGKYISDEIACRAEITVTTGGRKSVFVTDEYTFSPAKYVAENALEDDYDMMKSMLHFAAESQKVTGYNTKNLADAKFPKASAVTDEEIAAIPGANYAPVSSSATGIIHLTSAKLLLGDTVAMIFGTSEPLPDGTVLLGFTEKTYNSLSGTANTSLNESAADMKLLPDELGYFTTDGIAPQNYSDTYYFRLAIPKAGGGYSYDYIVTYSVTAYCREIIAMGPSHAYYNLCIAITRYGAEAKKYFAA